MQTERLAGEAARAPQQFPSHSLAVDLQLAWQGSALGTPPSRRATKEMQELGRGARPAIGPRRPRCRIATRIRLARLGGQRADLGRGTAPASRTAAGGDGGDGSDGSDGSDGGDVAVRVQLTAPSSSAAMRHARSAPSRSQSPRLPSQRHRLPPAPAVLRLESKLGTHTPHSMSVFVAQRPASRGRCALQDARNECN
ncbi:hypothetical protein BS50DRAFT_156442 [Corynespora cassiicola Philippines]|uniref:Uncharacterized protein n=1 Tax=Corynespora cassiicola Philippines TaxID=1448308 RepID=A0A2T2N6Z3_CORCC|nr:hypothetical protein BS50DRAFT_156442 [Corynespora cassiicola Philippines]